MSARLPWSRAVRVAQSRPARRRLRGPRRIWPPRPMVRVPRAQPWSVQLLRPNRRYVPAPTYRMTRSGPICSGSRHECRGARRRRGRLPYLAHEHRREHREGPGSGSEGTARAPRTHWRELQLRRQRVLRPGLAHHVARISELQDQPALLVRLPVESRTPRDLADRHASPPCVTATLRGFGVKGRFGRQCRCRCCDRVGRPSGRYSEPACGTSSQACNHTRPHPCPQRIVRSPRTAGRPLQRPREGVSCHGCYARRSPAFQRLGSGRVRTTV